MHDTKKTVAVVAGTRPEAIKIAPLYIELKKSEKIRPIFISTAQHRQMLDQSVKMFGITPDYDMDIMKEGQTLTDLTARLLVAWNDLFAKQSFDAVLVQGDTTTVLATAIAAFYQKIPVGHIEAGLRTYDFNAPFPEEMNRRLTDPISRWNFAPTSLSYGNLIRENISERNCFITGNTVVDSLLWMNNKLISENVGADEVAKNSSIPEDFAKEYLSEGSVKKWILVTGHRRENFGGGFENICKALRKLSDKYADLGILYPVHLNPNVQEPVKRILGGQKRIALIPPVDYKDFIWLMARCRFILSDSGGIQEEAPSLGKPVLVMRDTTERPEGIEAGTCELVGTNVEKILASASALIDNDAEYARRSSLKNPYGDGTASANIRKILEAEL